MAIAVALQHGGVGCGRRPRGDVAAGAHQGDRADAAAAAAADRRPAVADRRRPVGRRRGHRRRRADRAGPGLPRRRAADVRLRGSRPASRRSAGSSRTGSSRSAGAGTSSPTTATARTGGPSASTGSATRWRPVSGSGRASSRPRTLRRSSAPGIKAVGQRYVVRVRLDRAAPPTSRRTSVAGRPSSRRHRVRDDDADRHARLAADGARAPRQRVHGREPARAGRPRGVGS